MEQLRYIFTFDSHSPLLFTQFYFWVFFALVYSVFAIIVGGKRGNQAGRMHMRNVWLMVVSWFFYYKTSGLNLLILAFVTMSDWLIAKQIHRNISRKVRAKLWLTMSVLIDLGLLCYFKYAYFGVDVFNSITGANYHIVDKIVLPVGISFYLFQVISYTVDVYRGTIKPVRNILDFGFYVSFFPQLVAGPIVRASEFIPQLYRPFHISRRQFGIAVFWILNGLMKKIILSDYLAVNLIDRVFDNPLLFTGFENLFALFAYSLQVYADFSGYTDIAIGVALLMGFYLPQNFDSPYKSQNPQEFWRRWHQSLSRWLKSYVYIPLGGNRTILGRKVNKLLAANCNSFLTMLIGGLWHGASWNFVIWGGLNGIGMIVNKIWREMNWHIRIALVSAVSIALIVWDQYMPLPIVNMLMVWMLIIWVGTAIRYLHWLWAPHLRMTETLSMLATKISRGAGTAWAVAQTFTFITFTRLFFRSGSNLDPAIANQQAWQTAKQMVNQIGGAWNNAIIPDFLYEYRMVVALFVAGMLIHWLPSRWKRRYRLCFACLPIPVIIAMVVVVIFVVYQFITADMQPFIYFQF